jgi:hypothetical protein
MASGIFGGIVGGMGFGVGFGVGLGALGSPLFAAMFPLLSVGGASRKNIDLHTNERDYCHRRRGYSPDSIKPRIFA